MENVSLVETADDRGSLQLDLALADRYQAFSAELLRLSLVGITALGVLIQEFFSEPSSVFSSHMLASRWILLLGLGALAVSAGASLAHRYYSTDVIAHMLYISRQRARAGQGEPGAKEALWDERGDLNADLKRSRVLLVMASVALGLAAFSVSTIFVRAVYFA